MEKDEEERNYETPMCGNGKRPLKRIELDPSDVRFYTETNQQRIPILFRKIFLELSEVRGGEKEKM